MKKIFYVLVLVYFMMIDSIFAQSDLRVGIKYGSLSFQDWQLSKGNIELNGETEGRFSIGAFSKKDIGKNYSLGLGLDFLAANEFISFRFSGGAGSNKYNMVSLAPGISKDLYLVRDRIGLSLGMDFPIAFLNTSSSTYVEDASFHVIWIDVKDQNGNFQRVPKYDIVVSGERIVERKTSFYIRPQIGIFYEVSDKFKITLSHMRGYNPGKPLIFRNLDPIVYDHETFRASDYFEGDYRSTLVGIELKIR